ncbi:DNA alkylation repair protein [Vagococcus salmoninarum]|uniref:DNA alkylation repair protein n=1 Tax=Vagococcus salmoninarum TaxID=2739 RepID=A0A429ZDD4_9ENTE|nr:DNA alkylation repair protein [Vagococcus salmoninarum]RST91716.1 DNA alkylation repair protein [Vagococcus salmoninarum]
MELTEVMAELERLGTAQTRKTFMTHGAPSQLFGVKIGDLKKYLVKKVKGQQDLCLALFATGNTDAQYLAGLGINPAAMTKVQLELWLKQSNWSAINEAIVAGVTAESPFALELGEKWLRSSDPIVANTGWATYGKWLALAPAEDISLTEVSQLLALVKEEIHTAPNALRYNMNQFIIYVGSYCPELTTLALETAKEIGDIEITLATKGCHLPDPITKIQKVITNNKVGVKRKRVIC